MRFHNPPITDRDCRILNVRAYLYTRDEGTSTTSQHILFGLEKTKFLLCPVGYWTLDLIVLYLFGCALIMWNEGKLLLSKIVQESASQKNEIHWTDGQNTALSCTITRPTEIHQYWTVPRQTQRMTTPSFPKTLRLRYNSWRKGSQRSQ